MIWKHSKTKQTSKNTEQSDLRDISLKTHHSTHLPQYGWRVLEGRLRSKDKYTHNIHPSYQHPWYLSIAITPWKRQGEQTSTTHPQILWWETISILKSAQIPEPINRVLLFKSTGLLVRSWLLCIEHLPCSGNFWCMVGSSVEAWTNDILYQFIEGQTHFGVPRGAKTYLALNEPK